MKGKRLTKQQTREGYEYQDLIGIKELLYFSENRDKYDYIHIECSEIEFKYIDDIVCKLKNEEKYKCIQAKYTVDSKKYILDWDWLIHKKETGKSNLQKWSETCIKFINENKLSEFIVTTNRNLSEEIKNIFLDNKISWELIPDDKQKFLINHIGSEENCKTFFENCKFHLLKKNYNELDEELYENYVKLYNDSKANWTFFKECVRDYAIRKTDPITYEILQRILYCKPPKPLDQDFMVPDNYVVPDINFHNNLISEIINGNEHCIILKGSPGVGKSTYLSYLKKCIEETENYVVRHHFYLSVQDIKAERYKYWNIKNSILEQINNIFNYTFSENSDLHNVLSTVSQEIKNKKLLIIIDGLDHVWRDEKNTTVIQIILNDMFPLPNNIKLIVGTQPIGRDFIPKQLIENNNVCYELPFMTQSSIENFLKNNPKINPPEHYNNYDFYNKLAISFEKITNGHPLHLIYSIEYLLNNNIDVIPYKVESLPKCPNNDIRKYYDNLLSSIDEVSKQLINIIVISEIDCLKKGDLIKCLTANLISDASKYIKQIKHLLYNDGDFLKIFHESISAYINSNISPEDKTTALIQLQKWINQDNSLILKNLYLPIINASLGEYGNIININRTTILEYVNNGYPIERIIKFLSKVEKILFFEKKDIIKTFEIRYLLVRLQNALEFNTYIPVEFNKVFIDIFVNEDNLKYLIGNIKQLSSSTLIALSKHVKNDALIEKIFKRVKILQKQTSSTSDDENLLYILSNLGNIEKITNLLIENRNVSYLRIFFNYLCLNNNIKNITSYVNRVPFDYSIICRLCIYAKEQQIDLSKLDLPEDYCKHPLLALLLYLQNNTIIENTVSLNNDIILKRRNDDYEYYNRCYDLENYLHSLFFQALYYEIIEKENLNTQGIETYNGFDNFVVVLINGARRIAFKIKNNENIKLDSLLRLWDDFEKSMILAEVRFESKYKVVQSTITKIINDLVIILDINNISNVEFNKFIKYKHIHKKYWLDDYLKYNINYFSKDAISEYVKNKQLTLNSSLQYTQIRTDEYIIMAILLHKYLIDDNAKMYLNKAFNMALGYSHHKDSTIFEYMDSIEYFIDFNFGDYENRLKRINRIINVLGEITDSHENKFTTPYAELLYKANNELFLNYYNYLVDKQKWFEAEEALKKAIKNNEKFNNYWDMIISTLDYNPSALNESLDRNIVEKQLKLLGINNAIQKTEKDNVVALQKEKNEQIDYSLYPVNKIGEFMKLIDYSNTKCVDNWIEYWVNNGYGLQILDAFEKFYSIGNNNFSNITLDKIFELSKNMEGKDVAYKWLVRGMIENNGWSSSYTYFENAKQKFRMVKDLYPKKYLDFIIDSSIYKYSDIPENNFSLGTSRLIYYLLYLGKNEIAEDLIEKYTELLELDMADMPIKESIWK